MPQIGQTISTSIETFVDDCPEVKAPAQLAHSLCVAFADVAKSHCTSPAQPIILPH